jgi:hypothetical protein
MSASPRIWLLEPSAGPEDGCRQGRPIWQLTVAAPSASFARLAAERWVRDPGQNFSAQIRVRSDQPPDFTTQA